MTSAPYCLSMTMTTCRSGLVEQFIPHEFQILQGNRPRPRASRPAPASSTSPLHGCQLRDMDRRRQSRCRKGGYKAPVIMLTGHDFTDSDTDFGPGQRQRLCHQAVPLRRAARPHPGAATPA